jgi:hypothetical protein
MIVLLSLLALMSGGYLIPTLVAYCRRHHNAGAIFWLNFLLGWTIIGWVISLLWACTQVRSFDFRYAG